MADYTEEENKVDIGVAFVSLNCMKNEPDEVITPEDNLYVTQYRVPLKYENIFEGSLDKSDLEDYQDNLMGFSDNDAVMGNVVIKFEAIKGENRNFNFCNNCNGDYKGYCLKCSSLSHILNNSARFKYCSEINTPMDIVEIRDTLMGKGVFLLKTLPKNIIFGPFEGLSMIESTIGWKINFKKLANIENGNWMKNIADTANALIKNLDVFQMKENLYYQTSREIMEGEELLVYYNDEEIQKSNENEECYFIPQKQEKLSKIFGCTWCCLGFRLVKCLTEHKSKCPYVEHSTDIKDFELVQCYYCKIWMEKHEHQEYHINCCWGKNHRMMGDQSQSVVRNEVKVEEAEDERLIETKNENNLKKSISTKKKLFQCHICKLKCSQRGNLERHIKSKHAGNGIAKDYQCSECSYQTNYKRSFQNHLECHKGVNQSECDICMRKFASKSALKIHTKNKHAKNGSRKDFQCSECSYQTNYKQQYQAHLNRHRGIKPIECGICKTKFIFKGNLKRHMRNKHAETAKDYQCSECSFQTNCKHSFQYHLNGHSGVRPYECHLCMMKFISKSHLTSHVKNKHAENENAKDYQCSECSFQTNYKTNFQNHVTRHSGVKSFECSICSKKFAIKAALKGHIKNMHRKTAKDYQCPVCSYQTNDKRSLQSHLNGHMAIKPYECDVCMTKFSSKKSLMTHTRKKHAKNGNATDYEYVECSDQMNNKQQFQNNLDGHVDVGPFECNICLYKFILKRNLERHKQLKHADNESAKESKQITTSEII